MLGLPFLQLQNLSWFQLNNYSIEHTPTGSSNRGTLLYISKRLFHQLKNDLRLYDPGKSEPIFIKIICSKSTNVIGGCIFKHPTFPINDLTNYFISSLLLKFQKESSKRLSLLGEFNIDLLKHKISDLINNFTLYF